MIRLRSLVLLVAAACAVAWGPPVDRRPPNLRTVLAVFWSSEDFPPSVAAAGILREAFQSAADLSIDLFTEYFESDRFAGVEHEKAFRDYLARKYAGRTIDLLIVQSDAVLRFMTRYRAELFPDAPIVHSGFSAPDPETSERGSGITSIVMAPAINDTLSLALGLHPATQRVHVILHVPDRDGRTEALVRSQLGTVDSRVPIEYAEPATVNDLLAFVRAVPRDDLILYVHWSSEEPGRPVSSADATSLIAGAAAAPVYAIAESTIGSGVVGGAVYSYADLGQRLADAGLQVLRGVRAQDVPDQRLTPLPTFDAQQLSRWRIDELALPPQSRVIHRDATAWAQYKWHILGALGFAAVEAMMIGALVLQRSRRRDSEARNDAILRCLPDLMFLQSAEGVYLDFYARDRQQLLMPPEKFLGRDMRDVLPPAMVRTLELKFREVFASADPQTAGPVTMEYDLPMPDGTRHYEARLVACDGRRVLSIIRDITDRRRAEDSLRRTQDELATATRLSTLGEFTASIAHELNQPLAVVTMNSNLALRWTADGERRLPQIRAALDDVVTATARASDIVRHARKVYQHRELQVSSIDVTALVKDVCDIKKRRLKAAGVSLELDLAPGLFARGDLVALRGVLLNLIVNAIEAMEQADRAPRHLSLRTRLNGAGAIEVTVTDTGPGVATEAAQVLFRTGQSTKPDGMGIGLSTSRAIVEALGGRIGLTANSPAGATFTVTIPADATTAPNTPAA
jgi:signal transduction histidine kinase